MKVSIDLARCQGHGRCWDVAPGVFDDDEIGRGVVRGDGTVPPELEAQALSAAIACPERAVVIA